MKILKTGFSLIAVNCANCAFDENSISPYFENESFSLKEELFAELIKLHDEDVKVQHIKYKCTGGKLTVKFCHTAEFSTEK